MNNITEFKNKHKGQDIWVIAAGPTMNYIEPSFFENKITVGLNRVSIKFDCDYLVAKDGRGFDLVKEIISNKTKLIFSKHESGNPHQNLNKYDGECWFFDHPAKPEEKPDLSCIKEGGDRIVVSYSTITSAVHLAAYMGASNIILCGHDCGTIDGNSTIDGYYDKIKPHHGTDAAYVSWLSQIENHTTIVSLALKQFYGCNIHSLNPFINFNLEGHKYIPSNTSHILQRNLTK
tara:strand:- start:49500 stop:50198 length:699 start_codon:yes stop_codon:yes gene_type:complete